MSSTWNIKTLTADIAQELKSEISGKNVLITGVTIGGLGYEAAYNIAKYANLVILVGSNLARVQKSEDKIHEDFKEAKFHKVIADLSSLKAVREAAAEINALGEPIHVVIANATGRVSREYSVSTEGYENQFAVGHLAHFLLIKSILPRVLAARSPTYAPRFVIISSLNHMFGAVHLDDTSFDGGKGYTLLAAYSQVKSANVLFAKELAKRLADKGVLAFAVHPGSIKTNGWTSLGTEEQMMMGILHPDGTINRAIVLKDLNQGATSYIVAAFDPRIKDRSGSYVSDDGQIHEEQVAAHASNPEFGKQLWTLSEKMVEETFDA